MIFLPGLLLRSIFHSYSWESVPALVNLNIREDRVWIFWWSWHDFSAWPFAQINISLILLRSRWELRIYLHKLKVTDPMEPFLVQFGLFQAELQHLVWNPTSSSCCHLTFRAFCCLSSSSGARQPLLKIAHKPSRLLWTFSKYMRW